MAKRLQRVITKASSYATMKVPLRGFHITPYFNSTMARIQLSKSNALIDESLELVVDGLEPDQAVTVTAMTHEKEKYFASAGQFTSDSDGRVALSTSASQGGTYTGVSPMGLFWSMKPTPDMRKGVRLMKNDVMTPLTSRIDVYQGHVSVPNPRNAPSSPLTSLDVNRWYKHPDIERIAIREDGLIGTLFVPKGGGPYPGILDVFGSVGGVVEYRASLLASHGYVTFALGYIWYDGPNGMEFRGELEYYKKAVEMLRNHPKVCGLPIGLIGTSKGSDVCLLTAVVDPQVKAIATIGGSAWVSGFSHTYKGHNLPCLGGQLIAEVEKFKAIASKEDVYQYVEKDGEASISLHTEFIPQESVIPVENIQGQILFIYGAEDPFVNDDMASMIEKRLRDAGKANLFTALRYSGAGHLLEPPYSPHCRISYFPILATNFLWGGNTLQHSHAQEDIWTKLLEFFSRNLKRRPSPHKL